MNLGILFTQKNDDYVTLFEECCDAELLSRQMFSPQTVLAISTSGHKHFLAIEDIERVTEIHMQLLYISLVVTMKESFNVFILWWF